MEENTLRKELFAYCKEAGSKRELIVPYNPEQDGATKRKNKTIEECIRREPPPFYQKRSILFIVFFVMFGFPLISRFVCIIC